MTLSNEAPAGATPDTAAAPAQTPAGSSSPAPADGQQPPASGGQPSAGGDILDTAGADTSQSPAAGDVLAAADDAQQEGVPETYSFNPPEGFEGEVNQEVVDAAMAAAKEAGLSQKQFDAVVKFDIERTKAANEQAVEAWNQRVNGWRDAARTDKEFGGPNYEANVKTALGVVEKFGDPQLKAMLKSPSAENPEGLAIGNHPALLRFLNRIGKVLGDPQFVPGDAVTQDATDDARLKRLYPSMFK